MTFREGVIVLVAALVLGVTSDLIRYWWTGQPLLEKHRKHNSARGRTDDAPVS